MENNKLIHGLLLYCINWAKTPGPIPLFPAQPAYPKRLYATAYTLPTLATTEPWIRESERSAGCFCVSSLASLVMVRARHPTR